MATNSKDVLKKKNDAQLKESMTAEEQYEQAEILFNSENSKKIGEAIKLYVRAANKDYPLACFKLSFLLRDETYKDYFDTKKKSGYAIFYIQRAAELGLPEANYYLSCEYRKEDSELVEKNQEKANLFFKKAVSLGHPKALYDLGEVKLKSRDLQTARECFERAAEDDLPEAQYKMGLFKLEEANIPEAEEYFTNAAKQGLAAAEYELGRILVQQKKYDVAGEYFLEASMQNYPKADYEIGKMLLNKKIEFTTDENNSAFLWYKRAADKGYSVAMFALARLYEEGTSEIPKNPIEAFNWYKKAANKGHSGAMYALAQLYEEGTNEISKNPIEAFNWYKKAANKGHSGAMYALARLYEEGTNEIPKNLTEASNWYEKAAEKGHPSAQYRLAFLLEKSGNIAAAKYWYKKSFLSKKHEALEKFTALSSFYIDVNAITVKLRQSIQKDNYQEVINSIINGANINAIIDQSNSLCLAFSFKRWNILERLLLERESIPKFHLESLLDNCKKEYKEGFTYRKQNRTLLDRSIDSLVSNGLFSISIADLFPSHCNKYLAHLHSKARLESDKSKITKEKIGKKTGFFMTGAKKLISWHPESFLPMRIRIYFEILFRLERGTINEIPCSRQIIIELLKKEILILLECYLSYTSSLLINHEKIPNLSKKKYISVQAQNLVNKIKLLAENEELVYISGYKTHVLYVNFKRSNQNIIIRVDNLGAGSRTYKHPEKKRASTKNSNGLLQRYVQPFLVGVIAIQNLNSEDMLKYAVDIIEAKSLDKDAALSKIYTEKFKLTNTSEITKNWPYKKDQDVGNCVVIGSHVGLQMRFDPIIDGKHLRSDNDKPLLYEWLCATEEVILGEFNAHTRKPNLDIEDEDLKILSDSLESSTLNHFSDDKKEVEEEAISDNEFSFS